jgi:hypothetical protein
MTDAVPTGGVELANNIDRSFPDVPPDTLCVPCLLKAFGTGLVKGFVPAFVIGLVVGAVLAAVSAPFWITAALTAVGLGMLAAGIYSLVKNWKELTPDQRAEGVGNLVGGTAGGVTGFKAGGELVGPQIPGEGTAAEIEGEAAAMDSQVASDAFATEPDSAVFWSGKTNGVGGEDVAGDIATSQGGTTLEQLAASRGITLPPWNQNDPASVQVWQQASQAFANGAKGTVRVVLGDAVRPGSIWESVELPALQANPSVTQIIRVDPATGAETVIFRR